MKPFAEAGEALNWFLNASLQAALLVPVILLAQWLLRHRLSARWRFALWWLLILRLLLPVSFASPLSLFNYVRPQLTLAGPEHRPPTSAELEVAAPFAGDEPAPVQLPLSGSLATTADAAAESQPTGQPPARHRSVPSAEVGPVRPAPGPRALDAEDYLIPLVWGVWLLGVLTLTGVVTFQSVAFSRRLRLARQHSPAAVNDLLVECRQLMGICREVVLLETKAVTSPVLYGLFRHRILLPRGFANRFTPDELRHVLLHELAHVKRGDLWLNWLVTALQIVHWFNPLVWLGFARLRADRELACDELALLRSGASTGRDYGQTMLKLLEDFARPKAMPGLVGILEDKQQMRRRVTMIARFKRPSRWSALALIPIAALGLVLLTDAQVPNPEPSETAAQENDSAASDDAGLVAQDQSPLFRPDSLASSLFGPIEEQSNAWTGHLLEGLRLECHPDRNRYAPGDEIVLRCTITNTSDREHRINWHPTAGSYFKLRKDDRQEAPSFTTPLQSAPPRPQWMRGRGGELPYFKPVGVLPPVRIEPKPLSPSSEIVLPPRTSVELVHRRMAKETGSFRWLLAYEAFIPAIVTRETMELLDGHTLVSRPFAYEVTADKAGRIERSTAAATSSSEAPARFLEITTEIEFENWAGPPARDESSIPRERQRTRAVIGTNSWMIESDWNGRVTRWFTGTRIIARGDAITGYETGDASPAGLAGVDGLMGFDLPAAVTWQAFASGPAHRREGAKLYPPGPLWEQARLAPAAWSERTEIFRDGLGLPKSINLVTADGEYLYWYQVLAWTNVLGWNVPTEFQGVAYRRRPASGSEAHLTFEGRVTAISPATELVMPGHPLGGSSQPSLRDDRTSTDAFVFDLVTPAQALDVYRQLTGRELIVSTQVTNVAAFVGAKSARGSREELAREIRELLLEQAGLVITELDGNRASVTHNEALSVKPLADPTGRQPAPLGPDGKDVIKPDSRPRVPPPGRPSETTTTRSTAAAAPFVEIEVEIEIEDRGGSFGGDEINVSRRSFVRRCIVGTNSWMIENVFKDQTLTYWFTGTNIVTHYELNPEAAARRPNDVRVSTRRFDSSDGNLGRPIGVPDLIMADLPTKLVWQAFCSGPVLRDKGKQLFPPGDLWKQVIGSTWTTRAEVFTDALGLPKSIDLVLSDGQPIYEFRVSRMTQFKGWNLPEEFEAVSFRGHPTGGWEAELRFTGRITAISPASEPVVPAKIIQATDASAGVRRSPAAPGEPAYSYTLETSPRAFTRVSRESDAERVKLEFLKWAGPGRNGRDALFRVTNPGSREVLIWNVRQQVLATNAIGGLEWKTMSSDYPGRGWEKATIPAGGSTEFPMSSPESGDWRVCLLYSRLKPELVAEEDAFRGDLESIGPVIAGTAVD